MKNMKRKYRATKHRFKVLGRDTLIDFGVWPYPDVLYWGNECIRLTDRLPGRLGRLVPLGYATSAVKPADWEPFVTLACAMGGL